MQYNTIPISISAQQSIPQTPFVRVQASLPRPSLGLNPPKLIRQDAVAYSLSNQQPPLEIKQDCKDIDLPQCPVNTPVNVPDDLSKRVSRLEEKLADLANLLESLALENSDEESEEDSTDDEAMASVVPNS